MTDARPSFTIYTDGGADPNPGPGGWGAVVITEPSKHERELQGGEARTTNNRMELTAAIEALDSLEAPSQVVVFTDSQYLKKGITQWIRGWKARGWKRKDGPLLNAELWQRLDALTSRHSVRWQWVKGHAGNKYNERADALATVEVKRHKRGSRSAEVAPAAPTVPPEAEVFVRVSCSGQRGGWAALLRHGGADEMVAGRLSPVTANRLEIIGAAEALERLPRGVTVAVYTPSDYLRNGATQWMHGWRRRGWRNKVGAPVKNRDAWERLDAAMKPRTVTWPAVKGAPPPELVQVETAAKQEAR